MASNPPTSPGNFSYPPLGSHLQFNYIDSVITSWLVFDTSPINCLLSLYYWPGEDPWTLGLNQTAAANSTGILPLAFANGDYLGQFNFNYNASDGSPQRILSPIFSVDNSPQARAVTWSQGVLALPTPSGSAVIQTSISASLVTSSDPQATKTTSNEAPSVSYLSATSSSLPVSSLSSTKGQSSATSSSLPVSSPSSTKGSSLGAGPIAGIVVGVVVCAGLAAALILYRLRKPSHVQPEVKAPSPAFFQSPVPVNLLGEKDGSPRRPKELSADAQLFEMASQNER